MGIIEAQAVGGDEAALLRDVTPQPMAQGGVQKVRRAVVGADCVAAPGVDRLVYRVADLERSLGDASAERVELAKRFRRVLDFSLEAIDRS